MLRCKVSEQKQQLLGADAHQPSVSRRGSKAGRLLGHDDLRHPVDLLVFHEQPSLFVFEVVCSPRYDVRYSVGLFQRVPSLVHSPGAFYPPQMLSPLLPCCPEDAVSGKKGNWHRGKDGTGRCSSECSRVEYLFTRVVLPPNE